MFFIDVADHKLPSSLGLLRGEWQPQLLPMTKTILWATSCLWGCLLWVQESAAVMEAKVFFLILHDVPCAFHTHKQTHVG